MAGRQLKVCRLGGGALPSRDIIIVIAVRIEDRRSKHEPNNLDRTTYTHALGNIIPAFPVLYEISDGLLSHSSKLPPIFKNARPAEKEQEGLMPLPLLPISPRTGTNISDCPGAKHGLRQHLDDNRSRWTKSHSHFKRTAIPRFSKMLTRHFRDQERPTSHLRPWIG